MQSARPDPASGTRRVLVLSAGSGASNNLIRSLRAGADAMVVIGCHSDRFALAKSPADRNYLTPPIGDPAFARALRKVADSERVDLVIPDNDADVLAVSRIRRTLGTRVALPSVSMIALCQDKLALTTRLDDRGVPVARTLPVVTLEGLDDVFARLGPGQTFWCRMRNGSGSMGALPVKRPEQARAWIAYWQEMREASVTAFTVSEYLPGRDFAVQGLWKDGTLVLLKMCERLSYFGGQSAPSGSSSTPALARLLFDQRVADICVATIRALGENATGVFSIDLKENAGGVPCVTEVNAGRFCMITSLFDLTGKHNMAATFVRLALGEPVDIRHEFDVAGDHYLVRDLDTLPAILSADDVFDAITDARG
jgi:biotin carboxylase